MSSSLFHEDICQLFERSKEPFIFAKREKNDLCLQDLEPDPNFAKESIKAIKGIMDALLHLRLSFIMPCQLKFSYVLKRDQHWGLRHAICDRDFNEKTESKEEDVYNPEEYKYHLNAQNELMWNLGRIWLRFFTSTPVKIKYDKQQKINRIIDQSVPKQDIKLMLKKLLCWDGRNRISFEDFLSTEFFMNQQDIERSNFYSSVLGHLKNLSKVNLIESKARMSEQQTINPFVREIRFRCFLQYLDVDRFLQHFKSQLKKQYYVYDNQQKALLDFALYIISVQNYINMSKLNKQRLEMGQHFEQIEHRFYYAQFAKRMFTIKEGLDKTAKKLSKSNYLYPKFAEFFQDPDTLNSEKVYDQFRETMCQYARFLNDDLKANKHDLTALKLLTKIYIARTSSYLFVQMRSEVFADFMKGEKQFNIKKILGRVNECNDKDSLRRLLINIKQYYFA